MVAVLGIGVGHADAVPLGKLLAERCLVLFQLTPMVPASAPASGLSDEPDDCP